MQNFEKAHFLIIGQGDEFKLIKKLKKDWELKNVTILPSVSHSEFKKLLALINIGLFSLAYNHTAHNFPGKLLGYMVESKPMLGSINPGNDLLELIVSSNAGFVYNNGEDQNLLNAAISLLNQTQLRKRMGENSRNLLLREFSIESAVNNILTSVVK